MHTLNILSIGMMGVRVRHISIGRIRDGTKAIQSYFPLEEDKVAGTQLVMVGLCTYCGEVAN
jgi:hypothetical protein